MADKIDPLLSSHFAIAFDEVIEGEFQEVSGLMSQNEPVEYKASTTGGKFLSIKLPGNPSYGNITLKRGVTNSMKLQDWRKMVAEDGDIESARKNGSLTMYNTQGDEIARWNFERAWPSKLTGPAANATANQIAIEELEIVCEKFYREK